MIQDIGEVRRPGITKLAERLAKENPKLSLNEAMVRAKVLYTSPRIYVIGRGFVPNPDYHGELG